MATIEYLAGVCNIGPEEIARRRMVGWVALATALVLLAALLWAGVNPWWRLFIFFPATLSASGYLQAYFQFCSGFARKGIFNFSALGHAQPVIGEASKAKDKSKGNRITIYAALIGAVVAIASVLVA